MPTIVKQQARQPAAKKTVTTAEESVLDRIGAVTDDVASHLKVAIFGNPKTGKTRLACTFPKPALVIGAEDGIESVKGVHGVDFVRLLETSETLQVVEMLKVNGGRSMWQQNGGKLAKLSTRTGVPYATVILDNGTKLRDMRIRELWATKGGVIPQKKPYMFADAEWKEVWTNCSNDLKDLMNPLLDLPRFLPMNVVIIAQEQDFTKEGEEHLVSIARPVIGSAIGKAVCQWLHAECSYNLHTFVKEEVVQKQKVNPISKKSETIEVKTGKPLFCLHVRSDPVYWTGFRQRIGKPELPEYIVDPTFDKIMQYV